VKRLQIENTSISAAQVVTVALVNVMA